MRIGILTGGGDAPGLNGIIESTSRVLLQQGHEVVGILNGFEGVFSGKSISINRSSIRGLHAEAGTFLGTSNRCEIENREREFLGAIRQLQLDGLIVAGGDGTFRGLSRLGTGLPLIGVPKTIDNDLPGTELTFGYDTACSVVSESVEALWFTAKAHQRIFFVETMGRTAGWIALGSGLASYADAILIPEIPFSKVRFINWIKEKAREGEKALMVIVSEGAHAEGEVVVQEGGKAKNSSGLRLGGISQTLAAWTEEETGWESRYVVLGHLQRSRSPSTTDRFLTMGMGVEAARMAHEQQWGRAVVYRDGRIQRAPISDIMGAPRTLTPDHRWLSLAKEMNIFLGT